MMVPQVTEGSGQTKTGPVGFLGLGRSWVCNAQPYYNMHDPCFESRGGKLCPFGFNLSPKALGFSITFSRVRQNENRPGAFSSAKTSYIVLSKELHYYFNIMVVATILPNTLIIYENEKPQNNQTGRPSSGTVKVDTF